MKEVEKIESALKLCSKNIRERRECLKIGRFRKGKDKYETRNRNFLADFIYPFIFP